MAQLTPSPPASGTFPPEVAAEFTAQMAKAAEMLALAVQDPTLERLDPQHAPVDELRAEQARLVEKVNAVTRFLDQAMIEAIQQSVPIDPAIFEAKPDDDPETAALMADFDHAWQQFNDIFRRVNEHLDRRTTTSPDGKRQKTAIGPIADIDRPDGLIRFPSFQPISALLEAIHNGISGKAWGDHGGQRVPTHTTTTGKKTTEKGYIYVSARGPRGSIEATEAERAALWELVHELDDITSDVLIYCLAACMDNAAGAWIHADAVLNARKIEPIRKRGEPRNWSHGHRQKDRLTIGKALGQLESLYLELQNVVLPGQKKRLIWESPALVVIDRFMQEDIDGGRVLLAAQVQLGSWADKYREIKVVQFGYMAKKALEYNPKTEQAEKRLTKYLALHHRFNAGDTMIPRRVRDLLAVAEITADSTRPGRPRARLEKALKRMRADGVIGEWRPVIDADKIPVRKGFETWLNSMIEIDVPLDVHTLYALPAEGKPLRQQPKSGKKRAG